VDFRKLTLLSLVEWRVPSWAYFQPSLIHAIQKFYAIGIALQTCLGVGCCGEKFSQWMISQGFS
jgi:hypothetical protein